MLEATVALERLIAAAPQIQERLKFLWIEFAPRRTTTSDDFGVLLQVIDDSIRLDQEVDLPRIFELIETFLAEGDGEVREASKEVLEGLVEREVPPEAWTRLLGPRSRQVVQEWDAVIGRWTPGTYPELGREW